jgi:type IV secretory pathway TraG/TraD family ATPase VirD4
VLFFGFFGLEALQQVRFTIFFFLRKIKSQAMATGRVMWWGSPVRQSKPVKPQSQRGICRASLVISVFLKFLFVDSVVQKIERNNHDFFGPFQ